MKSVLVSEIGLRYKSHKKSQGAKLRLMQKYANVCLQTVVDIHFVPGWIVQQAMHSI